MVVCSTCGPLFVVYCAHVLHCDVPPQVVFGVFEAVTEHHIVHGPLATKP